LGLTCDFWAEFDEIISGWVSGLSSCVSRTAAATTS
jgi:hypothetical protein